MRVFWITAPRMQDLVSRLALVLQEHMLDDDELHVTYNAMQAGAQPHPEVPASTFRRGQPAWTELFFEYSAMVVLRERSALDRPHHEET